MLSDEEMRIILRRPGALDETQRHATQAHRDARQMMWAETVRLDAAWDGFRHRSAAFTRVPMSETPQAREMREIEALRVAMEARDFFRVYAAEHHAKTEEEKRTAWLAGKNAGAVARQLAEQAASVEAGARAAAARPQFSVAGLLGQLAQRGCVVSVDRAGKIIVRGAALDEAGRATIREHREAILAALTGPGESF